MSQANPTIVFLAGAFADPSCFDELAAGFNNAGYPTAYAKVLSLNPSDPSSVSTSKDAEHVRSTVLLPLLDKGKDVILFVHSYGGVVGGAAAAGLSKSARRADAKKGGIVGLLYLAGNIVGEGESLKEAVGGAYPPFIKEHQPSNGLALIAPVMETLYGDVDAQKKADLEAGMIPHALAAFETPATAPAWKEAAFDGRRVYVRTLDDQCNPLFIQDIWLEKSGVEWETVDMKTSHCPFISRPQDVVKACTPFFEKWRE